jgi:hypothetical protein
MLAVLRSWGVFKLPGAPAEHAGSVSVPAGARRRRVGIARRRYATIASA